MKKHIGALLLIGMCAAGCQSSIKPQVGMTANDWKRRSFWEVLVYSDGEREAWEVKDKTFYFMNGKLIKIDAGEFSMAKFDVEPAPAPKAQTPVSAAGPA